MEDISGTIFLGDAVNVVKKDGELWIHYFNQEIERVVRKKVEKNVAYQLSKDIYLRFKFDEPIRKIIPCLSDNELLIIDSRMREIIDWIIHYYIKYEVSDLNLLVGMLKEKNPMGYGNVYAYEYKISLLVKHLYYLEIML